MTTPRSLKEVDEALAKMEEDAKEKYKKFRESLSGVSRSVSNLSSTQNSLSLTVNGISSTQNGISKTVNGISITQNNLSKTVNDVSITQNNQSLTISKYSKTVNDVSVTVNGMSATLSKLSGTAAWASGTLTALTASLALVTVGISAIKIDEKGITIFGVTREFVWTNKLLKKWEEYAREKWTWMENEDQRTTRKEREELEKKTEEDFKKLKEEVEKIKKAFEKAGRSFRDQQTTEAGRFPNGGNTRGLDTTHGNGPTVRGVASDVRVLRAAVNSLATAFA
ncbi:hypothetical protein ACE14D_08135 [Streptomyces sp. Act-28]